MGNLARSRGTMRFSASLAVLSLGAWSTAQAQPDFSGVWGMVQHDRLGAPFFIPIEPKLNAAGKSVTEGEGDTLVIETTNITEWQAPRWPHSDAFRVTVELR
jgi:hypothetical protein